MEFMYGICDTSLKNPRVAYGTNHNILSSIGTNYIDQGHIHLQFHLKDPKFLISLIYFTYCLSCRDT